MSPPVFARPTVSGLIGTGSHGTGRAAHVRTFGDQVIAFHLVDGMGNIRHIVCPPSPAEQAPGRGHRLPRSEIEQGGDDDKTNDRNFVTEEIMRIADISSNVKYLADDLLALRCNLGCLGVIFEVTLQCTIDYKVLRIDHVLPEGWSMDEVMKVFATHEYNELFYLPFNDKVCLVSGDDVAPEVPISRPHKSTAVKEKIRRGLSIIHAENPIWALIQRGLPKKVAMKVMSSQGSFFKESVRTCKASELFHYHPRGAAEWNMEIAVPVEKARDALEFIVDMVRVARDNKQFPIDMVIHARFIKGSTSLMAHSSMRDSCCIDLVATRHNKVFVPFFRAMEQDLYRLYEGRPHWGKIFYAPEKMRELYGDNMTRFLRVREEYDPYRVFLNAWLEKAIFQLPELRPGEAEEIVRTLPQRRAEIAANTTSTQSNEAEVHSEMEKKLHQDTLIYEGRKMVDDDNNPQHPHQKAHDATVAQYSVYRPDTISTAVIAQGKTKGAKTSIVPTLPHHDTDPEGRRAIVEAKRRKYVWDGAMYNQELNIPSKIPRKESFFFSGSYSAKSVAAIARGLVRTKVRDIRHRPILPKVTSHSHARTDPHLSDYLRSANTGSAVIQDSSGETYSLRKCVSNDILFGQQRLAGPDPMVLRRAVLDPSQNSYGLAIPPTLFAKCEEYFRVLSHTEEMTHEKHGSFREEVERGNVFIINYSFLQSCYHNNTITPSVIDPSYITPTTTAIPATTAAAGSVMSPSPPQDLAANPSTVMEPSSFAGVYDSSSQAPVPIRGHPLNVPPNTPDPTFTELYQVTDRGIVNDKKFITAPVMVFWFHRRTVLCNGGHCMEPGTPGHSCAFTQSSSNNNKNSNNILSSSDPIDPSSSSSSSNNNNNGNNINDNASDASDRSDIDTYNNVREDRQENGDLPPERGELVPLGIQIDQGMDSPVLVPSGGPAWEVAKVFAQVATMNHHAFVSHEYMAHAVMGLFGMCTPRQLSPYHPINILLEPHLHFAASNASKKMLRVRLQTQLPFMAMSKDMMKEVVKNCHSHCRFSVDLHFPRSFADRNMMYHPPPGSYPYRDDGMLVWDSIHEYVRNYINMYYLTPNDVAADYEMHAWIAELMSPEGGNIRWLLRDDKPSVTDISDLVELCTQIIFLSGPYHASVHFSQITYFAHAEGTMPGALYRGKDGRILPGDGMLPTKGKASLQALTFTYGDMTYDKFADYARFKISGVEGVRYLVQQFRDRLRKIDALMDIRNESRTLEFPYFKPSRIPNSTNI
eukprot:TRINITY_DN581_c0_g1_i2.p1 TRINITY_DN581_c0_g1~~TRINITY_DN581_c0_g1_i2.p1  ORF type:complete len:1426 (+),score=307.82 TRINITY_DN581_c0_g1_i2:490-4278(+)